VAAAFRALRGSALPSGRLAHAQQAPLQLSNRAPDGANLP
jgi:hypothetical protein